MTGTEVDFITENKTAYYLDTLALYVISFTNSSMHTSLQICKR